MAARFVVGLALVALCHSSPVLINGVETRDGRSLSSANGFASGYGGEHSATANVNSNSAQASGISNGANLARDGLYYPAQGNAIANAQTQDNAYPVDLARLQGYYQPIAQPLPAAQPALIAYNQIPEQLIYTGAPANAKSSATTNDAADQSQSAVNTYGAGNAESVSHTKGKHGITNTNAKTYGGYNSAASSANSNSGVASVSSKAVGTGYEGYSASNAQANGQGYIAPIAVPTEVIVEQPTIVAAKNNGFYNPSQYNSALYNSAPYNSASSTANVHGYGNALSSAKTYPAPARRSISWRFGTAYDSPAGYGAIKAAPAAYQPAHVAYEAALPAGSAQSDASTQGLANAASSADISANTRRAQSAANSGFNGNGNSNAFINAGHAGLYRSQSGIPSGLKSSANTIGQGSAGSDANLTNGHGISQSFGISQGGRINANADISNNGAGLYRSGEGAQWSRTNSNIAVQGFGQAKSTAQEFNGAKRADSIASSHGGNSFANSFSL